MTCSPEKVASNRRNAAKSTGPRTESGKAIARRNSLKHGLTGEGVVMPTEQTAALDQRITNLKNDLQPETTLGLVLVQRIGILSIRMTCCNQQEVDVVRSRVAKALAEFDNTRLDEADALFEQLPENPSTILRKLTQTEPGLRKLLSTWDRMKTDLMAGTWTIGHGHRLAQLRGFKADDCFAAELINMSEAVQGRFDIRQFAQPALVDTASRATIARGQLTTLMDLEIASLNERLAKLDKAEIERARAEVIAQAKLDAAPAVHQIQKYEAATERSLVRLLKEARIVEAKPKLADQGRPSVARPVAGSPLSQRTSGAVASFDRPAAPANVDMEKPFTEEEKQYLFVEYGKKGQTREQIEELIRRHNDRIEAKKRGK